MRQPEITVVWLRDAKGMFPHIVFSGDSDVETAGWTSFTSTSRREVVICSVTAAEWNAGEQGVWAALRRVSDRLLRTDLRAIRLVRSEQPIGARGISFQACRKHGNLPKLIYSALEGPGESVPEREESIEAFKNNGGTILQIA